MARIRRPPVNEIRTINQYRNQAVANGWMRRPKPPAPRRVSSSTSGRRRGLDTGRAWSVGPHMGRGPWGPGRGYK